MPRLPSALAAVAALALLAACDTEGPALDSAPEASAVAPTVRLNAGADAPLDAGGATWDADRNVEGGQTADRGDLAIDETDADRLYQTERYGPMTYRLAVPDGTYQVRLHFAETYLDAPGARVFDVAVEGKRIEGLDVVARAGGARRAHIETVNVRVSDGQLKIAFEADVQQPIVNAIEVEPLDVALLPVTEGPRRALNGETFGYNIDATIRGTRRDDPAYTTALAGLAPGTIRFPGGTISNYWDWEAGDFVCDGLSSTLVLVGGTTRSCELPNGYQSLDPEGHTLGAFAVEVAATGATPVFVANMLTRTADQTETNLAKTLRMLREARDLGLEVRYLELGNEFYLDKGTRDASSDNAVVFPTVADYAREAARWIREIRPAFPDLEIAVVGADRPQEDARRATWNDSLLLVLDQVPDVAPDAITLHTYTGGTTDVPALVALGQRKGDDLTRFRFRTLPRDLDVWLTEYNMFSDTAPVHGTWAHGLLTASLTLNFLDDDRVTLLHVHSGIGSAVFGSLFRTASGFDFGDSRFPSPDTSIATVPFGRTASGFTLQLVAEAMRGAATLAPLDFGPDTPRLPTDEGRAAVEGWALDADRAVLLNLGDAAVGVDASAFEGRPFVLRRAAPLDRPDGSDDAVREQRGRVGSVLRLPPYSVARIGG